MFAAATLAAAVTEASLERPYGAPPKERGLALGLFSADPAYRYRMLLEEVAATGATHVTIDWVWWQEDLFATDIRAVPTWSATDEQILDTLKAAKALGLHVTAFPIVRLEKAEAGEWRGRIAPADEDRWWQSYGEFIAHAARLATEGGADRLSIGSELLSREAMRDRWRELIERVRVRHPKLELMYSANWDHYEVVSFWDLVDVVGITGYWELTKDLNASTEQLFAAWRGVKRTLLAFSARLGRPFVFSEIGYPSLDGGAAWPWDETRKAPVDQEEQRRAYEAFVRAWSDTPELLGVYWWNWFGFGGPEDTNYTPRKKPAAKVVEAWYRPPAR